MCPDQFVLGDLTSNNWPLWMKLVVAGTVMGIAMACLLMKTLFSLWYYRLEKKQDDYLESLDQQLLSSEASLQVRSSFHGNYLVDHPLPDPVISS